MTAGHRETMSRYYAWHAPVYDATRWTFLFGRNAILEDLALRPGETVVEIGCGTGHNFQRVLDSIGERGELIGVDCSEPMIARCRRRIRKRAWRNVRLMDQQYGRAPVTGGSADAVLMSYALSMIPGWKSALECAAYELKPGGRIGVVDFCMNERTVRTAQFARWLEINHVQVDRPYREELAARFHPVRCVTTPAFGGLWSYYRFVGSRGLGSAQK